MTIFWPSETGTLLEDLQLLYGMVWYGMVWYGMVWHSSIYSQPWANRGAFGSISFKKRDKF